MDEFDVILRTKLYNTMWDLTYQNIDNLNKEQIHLWNKAINMLESKINDFEKCDFELNEEERELLIEVYNFF